MIPIHISRGTNICVKNTLAVKRITIMKHHSTSWMRPTVADVQGGPKK